VENRVLSWFRRRVEDGRRAKDLYGASVTQARRPDFFAAMGVSDTPEGRAGMIMLHLFLVLDRLQKVGPAGTAPARALTETFVTDMDDCLREMGVGDLSVPKNVKRAAAELRARSLAYRRAMESSDAEFATELASTIPGLEGASGAADQLARYARAAARHLDALADSAMLAGRVTFPAPELSRREPAPEAAQ
jgi:cytochrome b pre-mRNA-processing protein 3